MNVPVDLLMQVLKQIYSCKLWDFVIEDIEKKTAKASKYVSYFNFDS